MRPTTFAAAALLGASLPVLALAASAQAQEQPQDEADVIVVTGTKTTGGEFGSRSGIPLAQIPQGVQVLSADDLIERGVRSVGDALRGVPSASVGTPRTSAYQSFSLKVRGFLADQMRNGVRQRYYEDVDASALVNVDRIEVLKGPSSVLFGQSAVGGIISIVTKRPEPDWSGQIAGTVGSFEQVVLSGDVTGPVSEAARLYFRANAEVERSGTFVDFQDLDRENASLSLTWAATPDVTAYFVAEWVERRTQRNPGLPVVGTIVGNGVGQIPSERFLGDPGHSDLEAFAPLVQTWVDIGLPGGWTLTPRFSTSGFDSNFTQLRVREVQADGVTVNRAGRFGKEDDEYTIAQVDLAGGLTMLGMRHELLLGVEYDRERATFYQENIDAVASIDALNPVYGVVGDRPYTYAFDLADDLDGWSGYLQDRIDLTERLNVILGLRASRFEDHLVFSGDVDETEFDIVTYQVGATYELDDGFSLFGGWNTGFDIESTTGGRRSDGTPFDPEESEQVEAGLRFAGASLRGSASVFEIARTNVLTADPIDPDFSIQTGEVRVRGLELEGTWQIAEGLALQGGYAFLDSEITESNNGDQGRQVADAPEHQATAFLRYDVPSTALQLRAGVSYVGERPFSTADVEVFPGLLASAVELPSYTTVDLGASYSWGQTRLDLAVVNALDETYYTREFNDFSVFPGEPLQASVRLSRRF